MKISKLLFEQILPIYASSCLISLFATYNKIIHLVYLTLVFGSEKSRKHCFASSQQNHDDEKNCTS